MNTLPSPRVCEQAMPARLLVLTLVPLACGPGPATRERVAAPVVARHEAPPWTAECGPARCGDGEVTRCEVVAPCRRPEPAPGTGDSIQACTFAWEEQCDPASDRIQTCEELGQKGGPVVCTADCRLDTSRCCYRPPPEACGLEARFCFRARSRVWRTQVWSEEETCEATERECRETRARSLGGERGVEVSRAGDCLPRPRIGQAALEAWPDSCGCRFTGCEEGWSCTASGCGHDAECTTVAAPPAPPPAGDLAPLYCLEKIERVPSPCGPGTPCGQREVRRGFCFETLAECRGEARELGGDLGVRVLACRTVRR
ncbi:MAG: hypothetical protein HYY06_08080 [Deltaproteobacteria bacterium]|nr:hypothetical protein [Deltaproteobacteria bacterium]